MKPITIVIIVALSVMLFACKTEIKEKRLIPWTEGAFETQKYRNLFTEIGYSEEDLIKYILR